MTQSSTQTNLDLVALTTTTVIDAGVRYGPHPSWKDFKAPLSYFGFDPDETEIKRLRELYQESSHQFIPMGLSDKPDTLNLCIYEHRGYSSFLELNQDAHWFSQHRPGEGRKEKTISVPVTTLDLFCQETSIRPDFLKLDTEGTELAILKGGLKSLKSILGLRIEVSFDWQFHGQALFSDIHQFLLDQNYILVNLDYFGRGVPRNRLFRAPDPQGLSFERYGVMTTNDGVWVQRPEAFLKGLGSQISDQASLLKYAYFCCLNHAPDLGLDLLFQYRTKGFSWNSEIKTSQLYKALRNWTIDYLGRWRVVPDSQWEFVQHLFKTAFDLELPSGHHFWEFLRELKSP